MFFKKVSQDYDVQLGQSNLSQEGWPGWLRALESDELRKHMQCSVEALDWRQGGLLETTG